MTRSSQATRVPTPPGSAAGRLLRLGQSSGGGGLHPGGSTAGAGRYLAIPGLARSGGAGGRGRRQRAATARQDPTRTGQEVRNGAAPRTTGRPTHRADGLPRQAHANDRVDTVKVERLEVSAYKIPTNKPEADGTISWESTTMVVVEASADGCSGLGLSYASKAAAVLVEEKLSEVVCGRPLEDVRSSWQAMVDAVRNIGRPGI